MKNNRYAPIRSLSLSEQAFVGASVRCRAAGLIPDKLVLLGVCPESGDGICGFSLAKLLTESGDVSVRTVEGFRVKPCLPTRCISWSTVACGTRW